MFCKRHAAPFLPRPAHPASPSAPSSLDKRLSSGSSPGPLCAAPAPPTSTSPAVGALLRCCCGVARVWRRCCSIGVPYEFHTSSIQVPYDWPVFCTLCLPIPPSHHAGAASRTRSVQLEISRWRHGVRVQRRDQAEGAVLPSLIRHLDAPVPGASAISAHDTLYAGEAFRRGWITLAYESS
jgi:hypothetical protein